MVGIKLNKNSLFSVNIGVSTGTHLLLSTGSPLGPSISNECFFKCFSFPFDFSYLITRTCTGSYKFACLQNNSCSCLALTFLKVIGYGCLTENPSFSHQFSFRKDFHGLKIMKIIFCLFLELACRSNCELLMELR